jgi:Tol biopolymer transport system component
MAAAVVLACLGGALAVGMARGDDAPNGKAKAGPGRLLVHAIDEPPRVPADRRFKGLLLVDPETAESRPVGDSDLETGSLSVDGRFLAGVTAPGAEPGKEGIWVYDLTQDVLRRRVFDRPGIPSWSNDSSQLVIGTKVEQGRYETYRVKVDGSGLTRLPIPESECVVDCSRDGSWLDSWNLEPKDRKSHILLMHPDGTGSHEVVFEGIAIGEFSQISPDGREVVYPVMMIKPGGWESSLWVVGVDGGNRRQIPLHFEHNTKIRPRWSPDGSRLAVGEYIDGWGGISCRVRLVDLDGKNLRVLMRRWGNRRVTLLDWK